MSRETNQPCPTLYVNNIESKIKKLGKLDIASSTRSSQADLI